MAGKEYKRSAECRERMRLEMLRRWSQPGYRENMQAKLKGHPVTEEARRKISENHKKGPLPEEHLEKLRIAGSKLWEDPAYVAKVKARLNAPEVKAKNHTLDARQKNSEAHKGVWAKMTPKERSERNKNFVAAGAAASRGRIWSPEHREKFSEIKTAWMQTPEGVKHLSVMLAAAHRVTRNTSIERAVKAVLDQLGIIYEQSKIIGHYEADFYLPGRHLVLECDGEYWHSTERRQRSDRRRDAWFQKRGYTVVRLPEKEIRAGTLACVKRGLGIP